MLPVAQLNAIEPWAHLEVPVLAIYGTSDFETELADHQRIVDVVNAAHAGTATLVVIPAMSHGFEAMHIKGCRERRRARRG